MGTLAGAGKVAGFRPTVVERMRRLRNTRTDILGL